MDIVSSKWRDILKINVLPLFSKPNIISSFFLANIIVKK